MFFVILDDTFRSFPCSVFGLLMVLVPEILFGLFFVVVLCCLAHQQSAVSSPGPGSVLLKLFFCGVEPTR